MIAVARGRVFDAKVSASWQTNLQNSPAHFRFRVDGFTSGIRSFRDRFLKIGNRLRPNQNTAINLRLRSRKFDPSEFEIDDSSRKIENVLTGLEIIPKRTRREFVIEHKILFRLDELVTESPNINPIPGVERGRRFLILQKRPLTVKLFESKETVRINSPGPPIDQSPPDLFRPHSGRFREQGEALIRLLRFRRLRFTARLLFGRLRLLLRV